MILTCPDCATSYFVDDERVPPQGRTVKCTSCGNRWRAMPETEADPKPETPTTAAVPSAGDALASEPSAAGEAKPETATASDVPVAAAAADDDLEFVSATPKSRTKRGAAAKQSKKRPKGLILGVIAAGLVVAAIGAAVLFRQPIVDAAPAVAPVFNAAGLKVDTLGLAIEDVTSKAVLQGGRPVLSITGVIRNRYKTAAEAPPIRISLLDKKGEAVAGLVAAPLNAKVPPNARRYFAVSLPDPPAGAHELEIAFDLTAKPAAGHGGSEAHGPMAEDAKPLAAGSPDALAPHDSH